MAKSTRIETNERVAQVSSLLLSGASRNDILQYASKKVWEVTDRQVDSYIRKSYEKWRVESEKDDGNFDWHIEARKQLYAKCNRTVRTVVNDDGTIKNIPDVDYRACLAIIQDIAKLQGLYVERVEHSGSIGLYRDMTSEQRQAMILEFERKRLESKEV